MGTQFHRRARQERHVPPVAPQGVRVSLGRARQVDAVVAIRPDHRHARARIVRPADGLDELRGKDRVVRRIRRRAQRRGLALGAPRAESQPVRPAPALDGVTDDEREVTLQPVRRTDAPKPVDGVRGVRVERPGDAVVVDVVAVDAAADVRLGVVVGSGEDVHREEGAARSGGHLRVEHRPSNLQSEVVDDAAEAGDGADGALVRLEVHRHRLDVLKLRGGGRFVPGLFPREGGVERLGVIAAGDTTRLTPRGRVHAAARQAEHALRAGGREGRLGLEVVAAQLQTRGDAVARVDNLVATQRAARLRVRGFRDAIRLVLLDRRQVTILRRGALAVPHGSEVVTLALRATRRPLGDELELHRVDLVVLHLPVARREVVGAERVRRHGVSRRHRRLLRLNPEPGGDRLEQKAGDVKEVQRGNVHGCERVNLSLLIRLGGSRWREIQEHAPGGGGIGEHPGERSSRVGSRHRRVGARHDKEPLVQPHAPHVEVRGRPRGVFADVEEHRGQRGERHRERRPGVDRGAKETSLSALPGEGEVSHREVARQQKLRHRSRDCLHRHARPGHRREKHVVHRVDVGD
mmetsp:Transcript_15960/g.62125  ORF Transcript_15960/g.62125 Transcript_15960/m.62125 type:complete len:578 (+) Transcript_15960:2335-4068(+)